MSKSISHIQGSPNFGPAAFSVLPATAFAQAIAEITQWEGYAPSPLFSLQSLA
ncbi:hypothetical protein [Pseudovibrio brasiliensis]|uniref:hypothetical protein n=1 Tax=Pseudovibrio brasiliensis TaxID=1898042 RepID=UPI000AE5DE18|nr:hypothetical protein [Pseudovibrio brasiliensis]